MPLFLAIAPAPRILAMDGLVLGEHRGGRWIATESDAFRARDLGRLRWHPAWLTATGGGVVSAGIKEETEGYVGAFLSPIHRGVLLSGSKPGRPRRVETLPKTNAVYGGVLRRWLDAKGMRRSPARITALLRVDLDGDGTKEVIIEARSAEDLPAVGFDRASNPVDYSLVLLRGVRNGKAVELPLDFARANGPQGSAGESRLRAIADLDGDGRMEVVLEWRAWEVHAAEVHSYRAGTERTVLQNGTAL